MSEPEKLEFTEADIDIIDFQSEDHSASQAKAETRPVPSGVKLLIAGMAFALIVGGGSLYAFSNKSSTADVGMDIIAIDGGDGDQTAGTDELIARLDKTKAMTIRTQDGLILEPVTEQEMLNERFASIEIQLHQLTQQIKDLVDQYKTVRQLNTQMGELKEDLKTMATEDDLFEMKLNFDEMLQKKQEELKRVLVKPYKKTKTIVSKKKYTPRQIIPFKLVSIDQWDGVNYAAIESNNIGALENLRPGDTRSGWKVERIDTVESSVIFKHVKTGFSIKQNSI